MSPRMCWVEWTERMARLTPIDQVAFHKLFIIQHIDFHSPFPLRVSCHRFVQRLSQTTFVRMALYFTAHTAYLSHSRTHQPYD